MSSSVNGMEVALTMNERKGVELHTHGMYDMVFIE